MRVVHEMAGAMQAGDLVAVFPEGTTGEGPQLLPFHANFIQKNVPAVSFEFVIAKCHLIY